MITKEYFTSWRRNLSNLIVVPLLAALAGCEVPNDNLYLHSDGDALPFVLPQENTGLTQYTINTPELGSISGAGPNYVYTPGAGFDGHLQLTYTVTEDQVRSSGTVYIHVDQEAPLHPDDTITRLNQLQMLGTHNSYHSQPSMLFHPTHAYTHRPLYEQLDQQGVRTFELDIHRSQFDGQLEVYHIAGIDSMTTCRLFEKCLEDIRLWSTHNPQHAPIFIWLEIKDSTGGSPIDDLDEVDELLSQTLDGLLVTPDDVSVGFPDLHTALTQQGWPTLEEARGKVFVVLLNAESFIEDYTHGFSDLSERAMFPRTAASDFDSPWAGIAKLGVGETENITLAHANNMLIATNSCMADEDEARCNEDLAEAAANGIHMIKSDQPDLWSIVATVTNEGLFPVLCNPVTASTECLDENLEEAIQSTGASIDVD